MLYFYIDDVHCLSNQNQYQLDIWHKDFMFTCPECSSPDDFFYYPDRNQGKTQP